MVQSGLFPACRKVSPLLSALVMSEPGGALRPNLMYQCRPQMLILTSVLRLPSAAGRTVGSGVGCSRSGLRLSIQLPQGAPPWAWLSHQRGAPGGRKAAPRVSTGAPPYMISDPWGGPCPSPRGLPPWRGEAVSIHPSIQPSIRHGPPEGSTSKSRGPRPSQCISHIRSSTSWKSATQRRVSKRGQVARAARRRRRKDSRFRRSRPSSTACRRGGVGVG